MLLHIAQSRNSLLPVRCRMQHLIANHHTHIPLSVQEIRSVHQQRINRIGRSNRRIPLLCLLLFQQPHLHFLQFLGMTTHCSQSLHHIHMHPYRPFAPCNRHFVERKEQTMLIRLCKMLLQRSNKSGSLPKLTIFHQHNSRHRLCTHRSRRKQFLHLRQIISICLLVGIRHRCSGKSYYIQIAQRKHRQPRSLHTAPTSFLPFSILLKHRLMQIMKGLLLQLQSLT